ncbi:O-acetyl-ADP-ribose deacetylase (regulator of RNase III), contains Macro domain [Ligilactobacillus sp. WC1T17]|uniref:O-acetyl-ADP-ribose deacetylase (Regulator of RNase III), contains Macro domain n=1 Tax=Ligilactobacillus ruminis TaxID=1623 RepID=A0ABY1AC19_9LACO|nr:O-acetyl-ADP-ribose deacetylase (regulator of RNase III), contains Macro domain [Ligilactobacillus ruminis]
MGAQTILEKLLALVPDFEKCQQTADLDFIKNVYSKLLNMWIDFAHENQTLLSADYQKQLKIQMVAGKKQFIVENETDLTNVLRYLLTKKDFETVNLLLSDGTMLKWILTLVNQSQLIPPIDMGKLTQKQARNLKLQAFARQNFKLLAQKKLTAKELLKQCYLMQLKYDNVDELFLVDEQHTKHLLKIDDPELLGASLFHLALQAEIKQTPFDANLALRILARLVTVTNSLLVKNGFGLPIASFCLDSFKNDYLGNVAVHQQLILQKDGTFKLTVYDEQGSVKRHLERQYPENELNQLLNRLFEMLTKKAKTADTYYLKGEYIAVFTDTKGQKLLDSGAFFEKEAETLSDFLRDYFDLPELVLFDGRDQQNPLEKITLYYHHTSPQDLDYQEILELDKVNQTVRYLRTLGTDAKWDYRIFDPQNVTALFDQFQNQNFLTQVEGENESQLAEKDHYHYRMELSYRYGKAETITGVFTKDGLPKDFGEFAKYVLDFFEDGNFFEAVNPGVFGRPIKHKGDLGFVKVSFSPESKKKYTYLCDFDVDVGDFVVALANDYYTIVRVEELLYAQPQNAPYDLAKIKKIVRKATPQDVEAYENDGEIKVESPQKDKKAQMDAELELVRELKNYELTKNKQAVWLALKHCVKEDLLVAFDDENKIIYTAQVEKLLPQAQDLKFDYLKNLLKDEPQLKFNAPTSTFSWQNNDFAQLEALPQVGIQAVNASVLDLNVGALVNAANESLLGGGGVDGAIHQAAGPELKAYCKALLGCPTGQAKVTPSFKLKNTDYIIHAVGPVFKAQPKDYANLASCYQASLDLALQKHVLSIAFPCIATGAYGFPLDEAAKIALETVVAWVRQHPDIYLQIYFCCYRQEELQSYHKILK